MQKKHSTTIFTRLFLPLFLVMLLQSAIFYVVTVHGRVVSALNNNALDILTERVANRQNELEGQFTSKWTSMSFYTTALDQMYAGYAARGEAPLYSDKEQQKAFLSEAAPTLFTMLRNNGVNGVFLILNDTDGYTPLADENRSLYGLCIRDQDPTSGYTDKEDLLISRCPSALTSTLGCPLGSYWEATYTFNAGSGRTADYFFKPLQAAHENPGVTGDNLAYFCGPHSYADGDLTLVSYSLPLIGADGTVYGVLGVELTTTYLAGLLPGAELSDKDTSGYMLVQYTENDTDEDTECTVVASNGVLLQRCFGDAASFTGVRSDPVAGYEATYTYAGKQDLKVVCSVSPLTIYNRNTPFEKEIFALVGVIQTDELYTVGNQVRSSLLFVTMLVLVLGCAAIFVVSHLLTQPIKRLAESVRTMGPNEDARLEHINIQEIDQLVDAIEDQSRKINQSRVRTEFFSRMSHDMRTPMNAIIGFSAPEIVEHSGRPQLLEYLGKINGSGKYLLGLINEVLDMTKIDSGRMELAASPFCADDFWLETLPMITELADQKGLNFETHLPEPSGRYLLGDRQRLSQVIVNLLSNAVKFTPKGGTVGLSVQQTEQLNGQLAYTISIRDSGVGMSEDFLARLYQPFVQEHPNREGTGLGLSIAHQLVGLMGGTIQCHSQLGEGTEFVVKLHLPLAPAPAKTEADARVFQERELAEILQGKHILLCEDHPLNRQIACRLLERMKMTVDTAENGKIGTDTFAASPVGRYDAVLMDIRMPVMDGLETARAIRAMERPDAKTVPILAMTANAFQEDMDASAAAGMNAHLSKPIEPQKLYQALAGFLEKK